MTIRRIFVALAFLLAGSFVVGMAMFAGARIGRWSRINEGNRLVRELNVYQHAHGRLPQERDWPTLQKMGFKLTEGTRPDYRRLSDSAFELRFIEGFDGPYLTYKSGNNEWAMLH